jgi:DNA-binding protein HU-beta
MTLDELSAQLAEKLAIPKAAAHASIHELVAAISQSLHKGEKIALPGLGNFSVSQRAERKGRNPATGAEIVIPAKKVVKFSAATALSKSLNGG